MVQAEQAGPQRTEEEVEEGPGKAAGPGQNQEQTPVDRRGGARRRPAARAASEDGGMVEMTGAELRDQSGKDKQADRGRGWRSEETKNSSAER